MNFVEWTEQLIEGVKNKYKDYRPSILIIGPGYNPSNTKATDGAIIVIPESNKPFDEWISDYRMSETFRLFDCIILSRVIEHVPTRQIDWNIYQLYSIMNKNAELISIIPDMPTVCKMLIEEENKDNPNEFLIQRLTYELLSEGPHVFDRHAFWSSKQSITKLLEKEKLFKVTLISHIEIDSTIVPPELLVKAYRV